MRSLVLIAALAATALPVKAGEAPAASMVAQDPLMRQIRRRMMQADGGVTTVTWVRGSNGRQMAIPLVDPSAAGAALGGASAQGQASGSALGGLSTDRRLAAERRGAAGPFHGSKRVRTPARQLHRIEEQKSWQQ
jgi:hypothetical protein